MRLPMQTRQPPRGGWMTVGPDVPDYSRPSVDVERRADAEWEWGVTHTVRPEKLAPMLPDVHYSITVKVQRKVTELDRHTSFAGLYARALTIAGARCHDFAREDEGVHRWVMCHTWRTVPAGSSSFAFAVVMMGLMRATAGQMPPPGEAGAHDSGADDERGRDDGRDAASISAASNRGIRGIRPSSPRREWHAVVHLFIWRAGRGAPGR